jgi:putative ABC transport system permease protein
MNKQNLKLALRVFTKNKNYFLLNLVNLTLGIVCGVIVLLYLQNYITFDKHHINHSRIYRVGYEFTTSAGKSMKKAKSSEKIGAMFQDECPEVQSYVRLRLMDKAVVNFNNVSFIENSIFYADTSIFNVFTHKFIEGDYKTCFDKKNAIVLVNSMARKYFGDNSAIGKTLQIDSTRYEVTGVIKDLPDNVHIKFNALVPFVPTNYGWFTTTCYTYLLLKQNAKVEGVYNKYPQLFDKYMSKDAKNVKATIDIILEPLTDIHFNSDLPQDFPRGNKTYLYIFGIVGLFIVVISSINYINMSTAFSINRTKEIGVKKIFGANKSTIRIYFLFESLLITMIAFLFSLLAIGFIVGSDKLYQILNAKLQFNLFENFDLFVMSLGLALVIGLFSGLYPAFHLASIPSVGAASSSFEHKKRSTFLRKALIVFQFILSIGVLISVFALNKQMNYINNKELGYNKENLMIIPIDKLDQSEISILKEKLNENPSIISTSTAYVLPNTQEYMCNFKIETESGFEEQLFNWLIVDYNYINTMQIQIIEGRNFDENISTDAKAAYIVNESFLKHFGWDNAVDKKMQIINGGYFKWPEGKIIGVVRDFNTSSLHKKIEPMIIVVLPGGYLHARISETNIENTIQRINTVWSEIAPDSNFDYSFMNDHLSDSYKNEINHFSLVKIFSVICFILSCLGLIGLSAYTIAQRTKEVAIRKQLGASIIQIIMVLYKDIAILIFIAICISIPLAHWAVNIWLESFAYRVEIGTPIFVISSIIAFSIGFLSVLYHSLKAAYINPIEALQYE